MALTLGILLVNDHWAKGHFHNALTGVASDIAGMVFFPAFLFAAWEWCSHLAGTPRPKAERHLPMLCLLTALVFGLVKSSAVANQAYSIVLGALRWPLDLGLSLTKGGGAPPLRSVQLVRDPFDLLALPFAFVAWVVTLPNADRYKANGTNRCGGEDLTTKGLSGEGGAPARGRPPAVKGARVV